MKKQAKKHPNKNHYTNNILFDARMFAFIDAQDLVTETGKPYKFNDHKFLIDPLMDMHPKQCYLKGAQIGMTTLQMIKAFAVAHYYGWDIMYLMPTWSDVKNLVGDKMNRLIAANPSLQKMIKEKDTYEHKSIKNKNGSQTMVKFRGTHNAKDAMSISSSLNLVDEVDACNQDVVDQYSTRLQASTNKDEIYGYYEWFFSHPSLPNFGVDKRWEKSDQKHWFVTCENKECGREQYLTFPESINSKTKKYICKYCDSNLSDDARRNGRWINRYPISEERPFSGYHISLMICPWVPASEILMNYQEKTEEHFYTKVLGLPYVSSTNTVPYDAIYKNVRPYPTGKDDDYIQGRRIVGVDTGLMNYFTMGTSQNGILKMWKESGYKELEVMMENDKDMIAVFDAHGDLLKPRELAEKFAGRIIFTYYNSDRKDNQLVRFGKRGESNVCHVDRNRMITFMVDELVSGGRFIFRGKTEDYKELHSHASNLYRVIETNKIGIPTQRWDHSGPDHFFHSLLYWRAGVFGYGGETAVEVISTDLTTYSDYRKAPDKNIVLDDYHDWKTRV